MKRFLFCILLLSLLVALLQFTASGFAAEWRPYRLVKDGAIDQSKWLIDDDSADIIVDGDRVKFVHKIDTTENMARLLIKKCPERIKGLRVTVELEPDVTSHLRARIDSNVGVYGPDKDCLWGTMNIRKREPEDGGDGFYGHLSGIDFFEIITLYDLIDIEFESPVNIVGNPFRLTMKYDEKKIIFSVEGYGTTTFKLPENIKPPYELFWSIGTRSADATGSGTVYFSDVEVLIDGECDTTRPKVKSTYPANDQRKVPVNLEKIKVTFNEQMHPQYSNWDPPLSGDTEYKYPKTFFVYSTGEPLAYGTWYTVCLEGDGFRDLAGNGNRPYCFSFKTEKAPVTVE